MVETLKPRAVRSGITRVSSVVLPAPLQPAMPMTFISHSSCAGIAVHRTASLRSPMPRIHPTTTHLFKMDCRVKPGNDEHRDIVKGYGCNTLDGARPESS